MKEQALGLTTVDIIVRFYLKLEFRARVSLWRKLTPAEHRHPNRQAKSAYFLHHLRMRVRSRAGHSRKDSRKLAAHSRWQVSTADAHSACQHWWLVLSSGRWASGRLRVSK